MRFTAVISATALVALASAKAVSVGGGHGNHDTALIKREYEAHMRSQGILRKRHSKRASSGKCKSKTTTKKPSSKSTGSSGTDTSSSSTGTDSSSSDSSSSTDTSSTDSKSKSSSSSSSSSSANLKGITGFIGENSGIGSWFRTNSGQDSTNGRSWCQLNYQDSWMGFAPSVGTMLGNFGNDITTAGTHYCGLEAKATNPSNGKTALIYIVDGFDDAWVRTPGSIDLTLGAFKALYGSETSDKNIVIQDLQWEFTGKRNTDYAFNASG